MLHVAELTLAIQGARSTGAPYLLTTSFEPLSPMPATSAVKRTYGQETPGVLTRVTEGFIARLHKH